VYYLVVKRPQLEAAAAKVAHREVVYDLSAWSPAARGRLTGLLVRRKVQHHLEGDDLVVAKVHERRVDRWVARFGPIG
jgi:hypothetical protein